jgi:hypothetical protein
VKTYRRIEITAFRRRVTIVSGSAVNNPQTAEDICISNAHTQEAIEPDSAEGRRILLEAVRLLEEKLAKIG